MENKEKPETKLSLFIMSNDDRIISLYQVVENIGIVLVRPYHVTFQLYDDDDNSPMYSITLQKWILESSDSDYIIGNPPNLIICTPLEEIITMYKKLLLDKSNRYDNDYYSIEVPAHQLSINNNTAPIYH